MKHNTNKNKETKMKKSKIIGFISLLIAHTINFLGINNIGLSDDCATLMYFLSVFVVSIICALCITKFLEKTFDKETGKEARAHAECSSEANTERQKWKNTE